MKEKRLTVVRELPKRTRFDFFLIWGHGLQYKEEIIQRINASDDFVILKVVEHNPENISSFVDVIYSHDYAPRQHLAAKTEYLLQTPSKVLFVFVKNNDAYEEYLGQGEFRHIECLNIKRLKESIRNEFNPKVDGKRSENHVVHASDNELQTDFILKYLGYNMGINIFSESPNKIINPPYHIKRFNKFEIKEVNADQLLCSIIVGNKVTEQVKIEDTPHYKALAEDPRFYSEYYDKYGGTLLTDNHSFQKLLALKEAYKKYKVFDSYILVRPIKDDKYVVVDGVHRSSVLRYNQVDKFLIAIIKS